MQRRQERWKTDLNAGLCVSLMAYRSPDWPCELNQHSKNETFLHSDDLKLKLIPSKPATCLVFLFDLVVLLLFFLFIFLWRLNSCYTHSYKNATSLRWAGGGEAAGRAMPQTGGGRRLAGLRRSAPEAPGLPGSVEDLQRARGGAAGRRGPQEGPDAASRRQQQGRGV